MGSLLYRDCARLERLPDQAISVAVDDDFDGELRFLTPVNVTSLSTVTPRVDCFCLSSRVDEEETEHELGRHPQASLCIAAVLTEDGSVGRISYLAKLLSVTERYGFSLLDMRTPPHQELGDTDHRLAQTFFFERLNEENSSLDILRHALVLEACGLDDRARALISALATTDPLYRYLENGAYLRAAKLDGFGATNPVASFCRQAIASPPSRGWDRARYPILISIHLQTNNAENFSKFCDRLANSCLDPTRIEVIVKIDDDHVALNELLPLEVERQPFQLKYISTPLPGGFFALWESMNDMLRITDPGAYFLLNLNDEMYFRDRGWDSRLERYVGLFPDHLYRLRTSVYKNRNYHDHWECGFAPETSAITTRRWIVTGGNWNPCLGPDTFQQCVAYYFNLINRHLPAARYREIPIDDIGFGGEGAYIGLSGKALRRRIRGATRAWFRLMSPQIQEEAARRAAKIHATIAAAELGLDDDAVTIDFQRRSVKVIDGPGGRVVAAYSFSVRTWLYWHVNINRALQFYSAGGGGRDLRRNPIAMALSFLALRFDWIERIRDWVHEEASVHLTNSTSLAGRVRRELKRRLRLCLRLGRNFVVQAPGLISLFYHRDVKHACGLADLAARRSLAWARHIIWLLLIGWPRRVRRTVRGSLSLFYHRDVKHAWGLADLAARRSLAWVKRTFWLLLIRWPRRVRGLLSLFYHRDVKHACGLADLAVRRGLVRVKQAISLVLIGGPRRVVGAARGSLSLFYHRDIKHARGLADLAARRSLARVKRTIRLGLIGWPRWVVRTARGSLGLFYHRDLKHARGLADLAARHSLAWVKRTFWLLLIGWPRRVVGTARGSLGLFYHRDIRHARGLVDLTARRSLAWVKRTIRLVLIGWPRQVIAAARGSLGLFYHRDIKHARGLADLTARRSLAWVKRTVWLLVDWPRREAGAARGSASLFYHREVKHAWGLADLAARRSLTWLKQTVWLLIGWPRRAGETARGSLSLFYHRDVKHAQGLADLAVRLSLARMKRIIWLLLIGWPRKIQERRHRTRRATS